MKKILQRASKTLSSAFWSLYRLDNSKTCYLFCLCHYFSGISVDFNFYKTFWSLQVRIRQELYRELCCAFIIRVVSQNLCLCIMKNQPYWIQHLNFPFISQFIEVVLPILRILFHFQESFCNPASLTSASTKWHKFSSSLAVRNLWVFISDLVSCVCICIRKVMLAVI